MVLTFLKGYPDFVGRRALGVGFGTGPTSYSQTTGDVVSLPLPGWYIDCLHGGVNSVSGTYSVEAQPSGTGPRQTWALIWFVNSTGAQVANGVNLSAEKIQTSANIGQY